jgi:hypothetical protein
MKRCDKAGLINWSCPKEVILNNLKARLLIKGIDFFIEKHIKTISSTIAVAVSEDLSSLFQINNCWSNKVF